MVSEWKEHQTKINLFPCLPQKFALSPQTQALVGSVRGHITSIHKRECNQRAADQTETTTIIAWKRNE